MATGLADSQSPAAATPAPPAGGSTNTQPFPTLITPFVDPQTGLLEENWARFLHSLWIRTGGAKGPITPQL